MRFFVAILLRMTSRLLCENKYKFTLFIYNSYFTKKVDVV